MSDLWEDRREPAMNNSGGDFASAGPELPLGQSRIMIGRWTVDRYVDLTRWPVLGTALIAAGLYYVGVSQAYILGIELLLFVVLGWAVLGRDGRRGEALTTGVIAGVGLGFLIALVRLVLNRELVFVVNIVAESMVTAIVGGLITTSVMIVRQMLFRSN